MSGCIAMINMMMIVKRQDLVTFHYQLNDDDRSLHPELLQSPGHCPRKNSVKFVIPVHILHTHKPKI